MQWFFYENDEKRGPVTATQLKVLATMGRIKKEGSSGKCVPTGVT